MSRSGLLDESRLSVSVPAWLAERKTQNWCPGVACQMIKMKVGVPARLAECNKAKIGVAVWPAECKKAKVGVPDCRGVACRMKAG